MSFTSSMVSIGTAVWGFLTLSMVASTESIHANGLERTGVGAVAMGKGGTAVASVDDPFAGGAVNPALLGYLTRADFSASVVAIEADGKFTSRSGSGFLDEDSGVFPELALRLPLSKRAGFGFSIIPEQARLADWIYEDAPGGIDGNTSYGRRRHRSHPFELLWVWAFKYPTPFRLVLLSELYITKTNW